MTAEEALKLVELANSWVFAKLEENLSDIQKAIIQQILEGQKLKNIEFLGYANSSIQREYAPKLWRLLEEVTGDEKVGVKNLQVILERLQKRELPKVSDTITAQAEEREGENSQIQEISESYIENVLCYSSERDFVGRDAAITDINKLVNEGRKIIVIQAAGGVGKTTLAKQYLTKFDLILPLEMAKDKETITAVESVVEEWLKQYFKEEPGREFGITLSRLKTQLQTRKVGVLIDNLEPALDEKGRFVEKHNGYVKLLGILADENVQSVTLITSRERLCDDRVNGTYHYPLSVLDVTAWKEFFTFYQIKIDPDSLKAIEKANKKVDEDDALKALVEIPKKSPLEAMHKVYGGNAKAMDILLGVMREDYDEDMAAYWQENCTFVETELKNLVESQFNRLQTLDPEAYKLLCRLGCFRYQDVPRVSKDALLALLWDIPEDKQRDVIKSLRNRCLVEFEKGEYWLHPVIREQGIERLKASGEWEEVNRKAAEFWEEITIMITTPTECFRCLEAYYHYIIIKDWNNASFILIKENNDTRLIAKLRSFGYIQNCLNILYFIRDKPNITNLIRSRIWVYIADANSISGKFKNAIYEYKKAILLLVNAEKNNLEKITYSYIDWKGALALLYMNLAEYEKSISIFEELIPLTYTIDDNNGKKFLTYIYASLSMSYFYTGKCELSLRYLNLALDFKFFLENTHKNWIKGYGLYNLIQSLIVNEQLTDAIQLCEELQNYSESTYFPQAKGFTFCGFGNIYSQQRNFKDSIIFYEKALQGFKKIGAKYDLAEAYYQLGLTYQKMGEIGKSHTNFNEAIRLFNEMEAPNQVEKVEKAIRGNIDS